MYGAFLSRFAVAALATAMVLAALSWATSQVIFKPPLTRFFARSLSFEIPPAWICFREGSRTDCVAELDKAYLVSHVFTARDGFDAMSAYLDQLGSSFAKAEGGAQIHSTVVHVGTTVIDGREWADAVHDNLVVAGHRSRILAMTNEVHTVVIALTCALDACAQAQPAFDQIISSIDIPAQPILAKPATDAAVR